MLTLLCDAGFALVGGPARQDAPKAVDALKKLNVPYLVSLPLVFQTTEEWLDSQLGVHPVQVALQVRIADADSLIHDPAMSFVRGSQPTNRASDHATEDFPPLRTACAMPFATLPLCLPVAGQQMLASSSW